ncbi:MAG: type II secretion system minor pseudopilin GspK [Burkholderiales bacterium]
MRARQSSSSRQRGAALLTAMIIVTLVATLSAAMVWQQWRAVQVETAERARAQAAWILSGALDFAKLILREDLRARPNYTALTEPWATPLAESRLSTFLAVDKANADDGPEAFLSGNITDAQARFNLNNLIDPDKLVREEALAALGRLCQTASIETGIASRIATGLQEANAPSTAAGPLKPASVAQLTWLGVDGASLQALAPYVVLLPGTQGVNVNTASAETLAAVIKGLDTGTAARLVEQRKRAPFKSLSEFTSQISGVTVDPAAKLGVRSDFFEVRGRLRLVDRVLVERSLLQRRPDRTFLVLDRERIASLEQVGG